MAELSSQMVSSSTRQSLPTGTVTFLFTDIEARRGWCKPWVMTGSPSSEAHNSLIERAITRQRWCRRQDRGRFPFFAVFAAAIGRSRRRCRLSTP